MSKMGHPVVTFTLILVGALLASFIMIQLTSGSSVFAFIAWTVFFILIQLPWLWVTSSGSCMAWLTRNRGK